MRERVIKFATLKSWEKKPMPKLKNVNVFSFVNSWQVLSQEILLLPMFCARFFVFHFALRLFDSILFRFFWTGVGILFLLVIFSIIVIAIFAGFIFSFVGSWSSYFPLVRYFSSFSSLPLLSFTLYTLSADNCLYLFRCSSDHMSILIGQV